jgi:uncharacterized protein HemX
MANPDRRVDVNTRMLVDHILESINERNTQTQPMQFSSSKDSTTNTYTISQILAGFAIVMTLGGSLVATWVGLNNQITAQKVSTELIFTQIHKDMDQMIVDNKELRTKQDQQLTQVQTMIKEISNRVDELDSTINQLYNKINKK